MLRATYTQSRSDPPTPVSSSEKLLLFYGSVGPGSSEKLSVLALKLCTACPGSGASPAFCPGDAFVCAALSILTATTGPECGAQEGSGDRRGSVLSGTESVCFRWGQDNGQDKHSSVGPGVTRKP